MKETTSSRRKRWFFARAMARAYHEWLEKRTRKSLKATPRTLFAEALEPRVLFSGAPVPVEQDAVEDGQAGQEAAQTAQLLDSEVAEVGKFSFDEAVSPDFTEEDLERLASEAVARWEATGLSQEQMEALERIRYSVTDLEGSVIGATEDDLIVLDIDAAGFDWFVDDTEWLDEEFVEIDGVLKAASGEGIDGLALEGIDLLSVIMHEQGHILGMLDQSAYGDGGIMDGLFDEGERRMIASGLADGAVPGSLDGVHYAISSAGITGDTLSIVGDADSDSVELRINAGNYEYSLNGGGFANLGSTSGVNNINIEMGGGTDSVTLSSAISITGTLTINAETITVNQALTVGTAATLTGETIVFESTIDGAMALDVNASTVVRFRGDVGGNTPLASIDTTGSAATEFGTGFPVVTGATSDLFNVDAGLDTDGNNRWEDTVTGNPTGLNFLLDSDTGSGSAVTRVTGSSSLPGIAGAYDLPGGFTGNVGGALLNLSSDPDTDTDEESFLNAPGNWTDESVSFEIWFKPDNLSPTPTNGQILFEDGGGTGLGLLLDDNGDLWARKIPNTVQVRYSLSADPNTLLTAGEFIQAVVTYNFSSGQLQLFVNGSKVGDQANASAGNWTGGDGFGLGTLGDANVGGIGGGQQNTESFDGQIAIFRAYRDQVLTGAEVFNNYNAIAQVVPTAVNVATTGTQAYGDDVYLGLSTNLSAGSSDVTFAGSVDALPALGGLTLDIDTTGAASFNGTGGISIIPNLTLSNASSGALNLPLSGSVTLGGVIDTSANNLDFSFGGAVEAENADSILILNSGSGAVTFSGNVGTTTNFAGITQLGTGTVTFGSGASLATPLTNNVFTFSGPGGGTAAEFLVLGTIGTGQTGNNNGLQATNDATVTFGDGSNAATISIDDAAGGTDTLETRNGGHFEFINLSGPLVFSDAIANATVGDGSITIGTGSNNLSLDFVGGNIETALSSDGIGDFDLLSGVVNLNSNNFITGQGVGSQAGSLVDRVTIGGGPGAAFEAWLNLNATAPGDWNTNSGRGFAEILENGRVTARSLNMGSTDSGGLDLLINGGTLELTGDIDFRNLGVANDKITFLDGIIDGNADGAVSGGTVFLRDSATTAFDFQGGTLKGFATFNGTLTQDGGTLTVGNDGGDFINGDAPVTMTITQNYDLNSGVLDLTLGNVASNSADTLAVNGDVDLAAGTLSLVQGSTYATAGAVEGASTLTLLSYAGTLTGEFAGLANGGELVVGTDVYTIDYGTGAASSITLTLQRINDVTAPVVSGALTPADDAVDVDVATDLVITFDEPVYPIDGATVTLYRDDVTLNTVVETFTYSSGSGLWAASAGGSLILNGTIVTIDPGSDLASQGQYHVEISATAFENILGDDFAGITVATEWNFSAVNTSLPTTTVKLGDGATGSGVLTITDTTPTDTNDTITISRNGTNLRISTSAIQPLVIDGTGFTTIDAFTVEVAEANVTGLVINSEGGSDTVTITGLNITGDLSFTSVESINLEGVITTTGSQTYGKGQVVEISGNTTLSGTTITFDGNVNSAGAHDLVVNASTALEINANVGATNALGTFDTTGSALVKVGQSSAGTTLDTLQGDIVWNFDFSAAGTGATVVEDLAGAKNAAGDSFSLIADETNSPTIAPPTGSFLPVGITAAGQFTGGTVAAGGNGGFRIQAASSDSSPLSVDPGPNAGDASFEFWFAPDDLGTANPNNQMIWETGGGTGTGIAIMGTTSNAGLDAGKLRFRNTTNGTEVDYDLAGNHAVGEWIHVVATMDLSPAGADVLKLFINGAEVDTNSTTSDITNWDGGDASALGASGGSNAGGWGSGVANPLGGAGSFESFNGQIGVFRMYRENLDATQITNNLDFQNSTSTGPTSVTIGAVTHLHGTTTVGTNLNLNASGTVTLGALDDDGVSSTPGNVTISSSGVTTLSGLVGNGSPVQSLTVTATSIGVDTASLKASGDLTLNSPVQLLTTSDFITGGRTLIDGTVNLGNFDLTVTGNGDISGVISGSGALAKAGASSSLLVLSENNDFTGGVTLAGGIIQADDNGALGDVGSSTLTFNGGTRLLVGNGVDVAQAIVIGSNSGVGANGLIEAVSGTGTLSGTITINNSASAGGHFAGGGGTLQIIGDVISSVDVTQRAGTVEYLLGPGSSLSFLGITGTARLLGADALTTGAEVRLGASGDAVLDLNGFSQSIAGLSSASNGNSKRVENGSATDVTLTVTAGSTFDGSIRDNLDLVVDAAGETFTLDGSHTYSGTTTVTAGSLLLDGTLIGNPTVVAGYRADFDPDTQPTNWQYLWNNGVLIGDAANYTTMLDAGTLWTGTGDTATADTDDGALRLTANGGTPGLAGTPTNDQFAIAAYTVTADGLYAVTDSFLTRSVTSGNGVSLRLFLNDSTTPFYSATVASNNTKIFDQSLGYLSAGDTIYFAVGPNGNNASDNFTWDFSIATGSATPGAITVQSGATLGGNGATNSAVTVDSGGTLDPGTTSAGGGTLRTGNLTLSGVLNIDIPTGGSADQVIVNGAVDISGASLTGTAGSDLSFTAPLTIISNDAADGVTGAFASSQITLGSTTFDIATNGGDGNDVTLTAPNRAPVATNLDQTHAYAPGTGVVIDLDPITVTDPDTASVVVVSEIPFINYPDVQSGTSFNSGFTSPDTARGFSFEVKFTPEAADVTPGGSGSENRRIVFEIGGTSNGTGIYLIEGIPHFISKMNTAGNTTSSTTVGVADLDWEGGTGDGMVVIPLTTAPLVAGQAVSLAGIFSLDELEYSTDGAATTSVALLNRNGTENWEGDNSVFIGVAAGAGSPGGLSASGLFNSGSFAALSGTTPVDYARMWNVSDIFAPNPSIATALESITATLTIDSYVDTTTGSLASTGGGSFDSGTGIFTVTGDATTVNAALASVQFTTGTATPSNQAVTVSIADGGEDGAVPATGTVSLVADSTVVVTPGNIAISGATGTGGTFVAGDTVTVTWDDTSSGDNNQDIAGVTVDFTEFGGGASVIAVNNSDTWSASFVLAAGTLDSINLNATVTATDNVGNIQATASTVNASVDTEAPVVTDGEITVTGDTAGAFSTGDTVTVQWDSSAATGDGTLDVGSVTVDFTEFGGGSAVAASDIGGGIYEATYLITTGTIKVTDANVRVTVTDDAGTTTTTADGTDFAVDNLIPPTVVYVAPGFSDANDGNTVDGDLEQAGSQDATVGTDAFDTFAEALAALDTTQNGTIIVNSGVYSETVDLTSFPQNITLVFVEGDTTLTSLVIGEDDTVILGGSDAGHSAVVNLTLGDAGNQTLAGAISGTGGLTKVGTGTIIVSNNNTYEGATNVNGGTLVVDGNHTGSQTATSEIVKVAWDQVNRNGTGANILGSAEIAAQERGDDTQTNIQGVSFLKFDLSGLTPAQVNDPDFVAAFSINYDSRVNDIMNMEVGMSVVDPANTWSDTVGDYPLATWVAPANINAVGSPLAADHILIDDVLTTVPTGQTIAIDVTNDVRAWVNGTVANNGYVIFGTYDTFQGAAFSSASLSSGIGNYNVASGATLGGTGAIFGTVISTGGKISPNLAGVEDLGFGTLTLDSASSIDLQLNGATTAGIDYDQLDVGDPGTVSLGSSTLNLTLNYAAEGGESLVLIDNFGTDPVTGSFSNYPIVSGTVTDFFTLPFSGTDYYFQIDYAGGTDGNDVVLNSLGAPETLLSLDGSGNLVVTDINTETRGDAITITYDSGAAEYVITDPGMVLSVDGSIGSGDYTIVSPTEVRVKNSAVAGLTVITENTNPAQADTVTIGGNVSFNGPVTISAESIVLSGSITSTVGDVTLNGDVALTTNLVLTASEVAAGDVIINGDIDLGSRLLTLDVAGSSSELSGIISGTGRITKDGAGALTISGANTYSGSTRLNAGTTRITESSAFGDGTGLVDIYDAGAGNAVLELGADGLTIANDFFIRNSGGVKTIRFDEAGTNTATFSGGFTINENNAGEFVFDVGVDDTLTMGGDLSTTGGGNSGVTKRGDGTLVMTGTNGYIGLTTVSAGTLLVNGDNSGVTTNVDVASGATLGGLGTIGGLVTISNGGTLAPGSNGVGSLTIENNLILDGTLEIEVDGVTTPGTDFDQVLVNGTVTLGATSGLVTSGTTSADGQITILANNDTDPVTGTFNGRPEGSLVTINGRSFSIGYAGDTDSNDIVLGLPETTVEVDASGNLVITDAANDSADTITVSLDSGTGEYVVTNTFGLFEARVAQSSVTGGLIVQTAFTGDEGTDANPDTVIIDSNLTLAGPITVTADAISLNGSLTTTVGDISLNGDVTLGVSSILTASEALAGDVIINGDVNLVNRVLTLAVAGSSSEISGVISGSGNFTKNGVGTLTISGANTYSGITTLNEGTTLITDSSAFGDGTGVVNIYDQGAGNAVLELGADGLVIANDFFIRNAGAIKTIRLDETGTNTATFLGDFILHEDTPGDFAIDVGGDDTLTFSGAFFFTVATAGDAGITKNGDGTLILSGTNTNNGKTTVSAGTFLINGDNSGATADVDVATGATLGGIGTIGGAVTIADGGILAPGNNGVGTLTIDNSLTLNGDLNIEVNGVTTAGTDFDQLVVNGTVTIGATGELVTSGVTTETGEIVIVSNDFSDAVVNTFDGLAEGDRLTVNGQNFAITYTGGTDGNDIVLDTAPAAAPEGTDKTLTIDQDETLTLTAADFGFSDPNDTPPDNFIGVVITTLPSAGTLSLDGVAVTAGHFVSIADINAGNLTFDPVAGESGVSYADFTFQVVDDGLGVPSLRPITAVTTTEGFVSGDGGSQTLTAFTDALGTYSDLNFVTGVSTAAPNGSSILYGSGTSAPATGNAAITDSRLDTGVLNPNVLTNYQFGATLAANDKIFVISNDAGASSIQAVDSSGSLIGTAVTVSGVNNSLGTFDFVRGGGAALNNRAIGGFAVDVIALGVADPSTIAGVRLSSVSNGGDYSLIGFASLAGFNADQIPNMITIDVTAAKLAPEGTDKTLTMDQDATLTITAADFGFSDSDVPPDEFIGVVITTLPTSGALNLDGVAIGAGDFISIVDINANKLTFDPVAGASGDSYADFTFQVVDDGFGTVPTNNVVAITNVTTTEGYNISGNNSGSQTLTSFTDAGGTYTDLKFVTSLSQPAPGGAAILHGDGTTSPGSGTAAMTDNRIDTGVLNPDSATVYQFSDTLKVTDKIFVFANNINDRPTEIKAYGSSGVIGTVSIGTIGSLGTFDFERNDGAVLSGRTFGGFSIDVADFGIADPSTILGIQFTGDGNQDLNLVGFASVPAGDNTDRTANTITIDVIPQLEVSITANQPNAAEPSTDGQFTVSLNRTSGQDTVVSYVVTGDATAGSDYAALTGEVTILAGNTSAVIDVSVLADSFVENSETVIVTLTGVTGAPTADTTSFQDGVSPTAAFDSDIGFLRESNPDAVFGGDANDNRLLLGSQNQSNEFNVIVEFDLSSFTGLSDGAELTFPLQATYTGPGFDLSIFEYDFDFAAATATWNNPSGFGTDTTPGGTEGRFLSTVSVATNTAGALVIPSSAALNSAVNKALASGDTTLRLLLKGDGSTEFLRLHGNGSGVSAASRPSLEITASAATIGTSSSATVTIADGPVTTNVIYVDNTWVDQTAFDADPDADDGTTVAEKVLFNTNAFNNLADALAAVDVGGTIIINGGSGSYTGLTLNKDVTLQISGEIAQAVTITELSSVAGTRLDIQGASALTVENAGNLAMESIISGSGSLTKTGAGTLTLSGANDYTGATTVSGGEILVGSDTALGTGAAGTTVAGGATLILADGVTVADENVAISGAGDNFGGALKVEAGGNAEWGGDVLLSTTPRIGADDGGNLTISGVIRDNGSSNLVISAANGGSGTVTLSGANTYTGSTNITRGTLALGADNTLPVTTALVVDNSTANDDSILDLNGFDQTVDSLRQSNLGGTGASRVINSAATSNTLTVSGNLAYRGTLQLGLDGANDSADLVGVGGNLDITNTTLDLSALDSFPDDASYTLLTYGGTLTGAAFASVVGLPAGYQLDFSTSGEINLVTVSDAIAPTFTSIERQTPATSPTAADTLVFLATFSEDVQNVDPSDFVVNGSTTATVTGVNQLTTSTYEITVSGGDLAGFDGVVGVDLAGGQNIADLAGNALPAGEPATDETYTVDNTGSAPVITPTANPADDIFTVTIDFGEEVNGFVAGDINVSGGTVTNLVDNGGGLFTATIDADTPGLVSIDIPANAATDLSGNPSAVAVQSVVSVRIPDFVATPQAVDEDNTLTIDMLLASNLDAATLSVVSLNTFDPLSDGGGTLTAGPTANSVIYTPPAAFQELSAGETITDTFFYTLSEPSGGISTPTKMTITVTGVNDIPVLAPDVVVVAEGGVGAPESAGGNVLSNDSDLDQNGVAPDDVLTVVQVNFNGAAFEGATNTGGAVAPGGSVLVDGRYGTLLVKSNGEFVYTTDSNLPTTRALESGDVGVERFTYQVSDGNGGLVTEMITVNVMGTDGGVIGDFLFVGGSGILEGFRFAEPGGFSFGRGDDTGEEMPLLTLMPTYSGSAAPGTILTIRILGAGGIPLPGGEQVIVAGGSGVWSVSFHGLILDDGNHYIQIESRPPAWDIGVRGVFETYFSPGINGTFTEFEELSVESIFGRRLSSVALDLLEKESTHPLGSNEDWRNANGME